jgi:maleylacetoacetate isomerase
VTHLLLYSYWRSSASYRVRIALELKGLCYEYAPVDFLANGGLQYGADYRCVNPQARVPTLVCEKEVLTQSMAIMEWLEERYPDPALLPNDPGQRARVRAIAQLLVADIQPLQNVSVTRYLREQLKLSEQGVREWLRAWIGRGFGALEELLGQAPQSGDYCMGGAPTLADACLIPQCYSSRRFGVEPELYPRIARIERHCRTLAAFQKAAPEQQPDANN